MHAIVYSVLSLLGYRTVSPHHFSGSNTIALDCAPLTPCEFQNGLFVAEKSAP